MRKKLICAGISMLCMAVWTMGGCAGDSSDNALNAGLLLGLGAMTEEEAAFSIVTSLPNAQNMAQGTGGSSSVLSTKEMIVEINKKVSSAFLSSELSAPGARTSISFVSDEACESGTCYTLSGTGNCLNGGTMTMNDLKVSLDMVSGASEANMTGTMNGSITYANCGGRSRSWLDYPNYVYAVIDGTVAQNDHSEIISILLGGDMFSGSYTVSDSRKGSRTVASEAVSVNGRNFSPVQLNCSTDLMTVTRVSNSVFVTDGNILTISGDFVETITGNVTVDGTLGLDNEIHAERIFNTETFRYHSSCRLDEDNFSVSCSVNMM